MPRTIGIGLQDFCKIKSQNIFYIDKSLFIKEWWESMDDVTLITRPRRFGKTLTMSMVESFFSVQYANSPFFKDLKIWEEEKFRKLQGTYPVISLSFSNIKEASCLETKNKICKTIQLACRNYQFLLKGSVLSDDEKAEFQRISSDMADFEAALALLQLSGYLQRYYQKNVIILLDEYDTPMQEAYVHGYWDSLSSFIQGIFNATFKNNPYLERGILTGITRVGKESIFSDLNNLEIVTTTSHKYQTAFGFTEDEVFKAMEEYSLSSQKEEVKYWYDGFTFGDKKDIYNPWSIINYLDKKRVAPYWSNTSSNRLVSILIQKGSSQIKKSFEALLAGKTIQTEIDEQIVYNQLDMDEAAIWSLLLASGYLSVKDYRIESSHYDDWKQVYELQLTNFEVKLMFRKMVQGWFAPSASNYNEFIKALFKNDLKAMNVYMNRVALATFSFFDSGNRPSAYAEPERFYHGFVLGLMVELSDIYTITSNRESGFGRYDVLLEPKKPGYDGIILEFKIQDEEEEKTLSDTVLAALKQIEEKKYTQALSEKGISENQIRRYGFAFRGKEVLIGTN